LKTSGKKEVKLTVSDKYKIINSLKIKDEKIILNKLFKIADVSKSGYYKYLKEIKLREYNEEKDFNLIKKVFIQNKGKFGYRRIAMELNMNHKKVHRLMKKNNLKSLVRRKKKANILSNRLLKENKAPNLLNRQFKQNTPYRFLSTDITYINYDKNNRWAYLSVVKDIASGEILTYHLSKKMNLELVFTTINKLKKHFKSNKLKLDNILIHSDQGFQYTHTNYKKILNDLNIIQSMSRKGNSIDNAIIETFFGHLKDEIDFKDINSFSELKNIIKEYMIYFNNKRPQWNKNKMTPVEYREYLLKEN